MAKRRALLMCTPVYQLFRISLRVERGVVSDSGQWLSPRGAEQLSQLVLMKCLVSQLLTSTAASSSDSILIPLNIKINSS